MTQTATPTTTPTATSKGTPTATATLAPALLAACASPTPLDSDGAFPAVSAGNGQGAVMWVDNSFQNLVFSFFDGSIFETPVTVFSGSDSLFLDGLGGNPRTNQYYPLFNDSTAGTLNVLEVNSDGSVGAAAAGAARVPGAQPAASPSPISLGSFNTGVIAVDPTTDTVYVGAQNGVSAPQLFVSTNNGASFPAGPTLPMLPAASLLNGIAANSGTLAVLYSSGGSEEALILPSGASSFNSAVTMFSDTNGSFLVNGTAMNADQTLVVGVLDTPSGGSTSAIQSALMLGGTTPTTTTLATGVSEFPQPGGGIQSNGDTAFAYVDPGDLNIAQTQNWTLQPGINTGLNAPSQAAFGVDDGFGLLAFLLGASTPGAVNACPVVSWAGDGSIASQVVPHSARSR